MINESLNSIKLGENKFNKNESEITDIENDFENWEPDKFSPIQEIKIISFKEKNDWELVAKYNIGKKKVA